MSKETKVDRKAIKRPDTFVAKGRQALETMFKNRSGVAGALGVTALLVGGYYAYDWWSSRVSIRDWVAYHRAEEATGADRVAKWKAAYEGGGRTRGAFLSAVSVADHYYDAARRKAEAERIRTVTGKERAAKKAGTVEDDVARDLEPTLTLAQTAETAADWYGKALKFSFLRPEERELLTLDRGHALELQGKNEDALKEYKSVVNDGGQSKALAMLHAGRIHETRNEKDAAKDLYQAIASEFGTTEYARIAKNYLRRMSSPLLTSPSAKP